MTDDSFEQIAREAETLRDAAKQVADQQRVDLLRNGLANRNVGPLNRAVEGVDNLKSRLQRLGRDTIDKRSGNEAATIVADNFGIMAGALRRLVEQSPDDATRSNRLLASREAYDAGFELEADEGFEVASTYNEIQRLVIRILDHEQSIESASDLARVAVKDGRSVLDALRGARAHVDQLLDKVTPGDVWRMADRSLIETLVLDVAGADRVEQIWAEFVEKASQPYMFSSTTRVLDALAARMRPGPLQDNLAHASRFLEQIREEKLRGDDG